MNCPGCNSSNWEYPDVSIARCKNCGYLLDPYVFGMKDSSSYPKPTDSQRSENSKRWAIIAFLVSILFFIASTWVSDWIEFGIIALAASILLFLDHIMYL